MAAQTNEKRKEKESCKKLIKFSLPIVKKQIKRKDYLKMSRHSRESRASKELEKRFNTAPLTLAIERDRGEYWGRFKQTGDKPLNWSVRGDDGSGTNVEIYAGLVLVRDNKVLYYDRCPFSGRKLRINKIPEKNMRAAAKIISRDIEEILQKSTKGL